MKANRYARLSILGGVLGIALLAGACRENPLEEGFGDPVAITASRALTRQLVGAPFTVTYTVVDARRNRVPEAVAVTSSKPSVQVDSVKFIRELSETRAYMRATAADSTAVNYSVGGLSGTTIVVSTAP